jgi:hypothetical protein
MCFVIAASSLVTAQDTPGFQFLGYGYDVLHGNPRSTQGDGDPGFRTNVFKFTHNDGQMTPDDKWQVPDKTTSQDFGRTCSATQNTRILDSAYDYQHTVKNGISLDVGFMGLEFSLSTDFKNVDNETRTNTSIFAQIDAKCVAYEITMHTFDHPTVDPNFIAGVNSLPGHYDEKSYMAFLRSFGTHVVTQMQVGGQWGWQLTFDRFAYTNMLDNAVDVAAGIEYAGKVRAGIHFNHSSETTDFMSVVSSISKNSSFNVGGSFNPDMMEWMKSVKAQPMPTHLTLVSLDELFTPAYVPNCSAALLAARASAMRQAIQNYCPYVQKHVDPTAICKSAQPLPPPQPDPVEATAVRRLCVLNHGGYSMNFELHDLTSQYPVTATSGDYNLGQTDCLDGVRVGARRKDKLNCRANVIGGKSQDCTGGEFTYDPRAKQQANFQCDGTTYTIMCKFTGLSPYGETNWVDAPMAKSTVSVDVVV